MKNFFYTLGLFVLPVIAGAQEDDNTSSGIPLLSETNEGLGGLFSFVGDVITTTIPLIIGFAVLLFLFGVLKYVTNGGDPEKRTEARNTMIWGIIAIFVMVSVWGLVNVLTKTFKLENDEIPEGPGIPQPKGSGNSNNEDN